MSFASAHRFILSLLARNPRDGRSTAFIREFLCFGYKEAISCIFPAFIFGMLAITRFFPIPGVPRYDLLLALFLGMQIYMYRAGFETYEEVIVICIFHFLGVSMEIFKVSHGSWSYPDVGYTKVLGVPLYSGFMYASIASYICQAWKHFTLRFEDWPPVPQSIFVAFCIYGNFYSNAYIVDLRLIVLPILVYVFRNTVVYFHTNGNVRRMPLIAGFFLIAFFVWLAENIGTFLGAWRYPHQSEGWSLVKLQIMSSWFFLVVVSVIIVSLLRQLEGDDSVQVTGSLEPLAAAG